MSAQPNQHMIGSVSLDELDGTRFITMATGIDDAPEIRSAIESRSQQNGAWDADGFYGARVIQFEGFAEAPTSAAAHAFADSLRALSPAVLHELIVASDGRGVRSAKVRMQSGPVLEWIGDDTFTYVLTVVAPDPLLYGPIVVGTTSLAEVTGTGLVFPLAFPLDFGVDPGTTPGAASLPNAGTAGYFLASRLDGPMPNPVVTVNETGEWVRYSGTVLAGQWLEVDCGRRRVLLNGTVDVTYRVLSSPTWPSIPPGGASVSIAADAGDPNASLTVYGYEGAWT